MYQGWMGQYKEASILMWVWLFRTQCSLLQLKLLIEENSQLRTQTMQNFCQQDRCLCSVLGQERDRCESVVMISIGCIFTIISMYAQHDHIMWQSSQILQFTTPSMLNWVCSSIETLRVKSTMTIWWNLDETFQCGAELIPVNLQSIWIIVGGPWRRWINDHHVIDCRAYCDWIKLFIAVLVRKIVLLSRIPVEPSFTVFPDFILSDDEFSHEVLISHLSAARIGPIISLPSRDPSVHALNSITWIRAYCNFKSRICLQSLVSFERPSQAEDDSRKLSSLIGRCGFVKLSS